MNNSIIDITNCRVCGSDKLIGLFSLGSQALTGVFVKPGQPDPLTVPLNLVICHSCKFLQSSNTVNPSLMYAEYWYRSGTNKTMIDHLTGIVNDVNNMVRLNAGDIVIDIGCNDGTLLAAYDAPELIRVGVDPSNAIQTIKDHTVIKVNDYFSYQNIEKILARNKAKAITSISMFYDLDGPNDFVEDIVKCLDPEGIWVVEMNYTGTMIGKLGYDMISHEHLGYYTLRTFQRLIEQHGLYVNHVMFNPINGGSIRIFSSPRDARTPEVDKVLAQELANGLEDLTTYKEYTLKLAVFKQKLTAFLRGLREKGNRIAVYGASTRGNTILQHCELKRDVLFAASDRNPGKWGLETPGSRIPIWPEQDVRQCKPDYMLVLPYYFLDEFISREQAYLEAGGKFIVPLHQLRVISLKNGKIFEQIVN